MRLDSLLDTELLNRHITDGNIRAQRHPTEPLTIYCYTPAASYRRAWDNVTRTCRGLIVDDDGTIRARPFAKFWNLGEHGPDTYAGPLNLTPPLSVSEKADGSLGIAYTRPSDGRLAWATKGSFTSQQANWANNWWEINGTALADPHRFTYLAEIVYPQNRIVVDYGDTQALIYLAALDIYTGKAIDRGDEPLWWPGLVATRELHDTIDTLRLGLPNREGYVITSADRLTRVKVKEAEYLRLHAIVTNCSARTIWKCLADGADITEFISNVPDEFADWAKRIANELTRAHAETLANARSEHARILAMLPTCWTRRDYADHATNADHPALLFMLLDGNTDKLNQAAWAMVRPTADRPFTTDDDTED